jgi:adenylate kinase family enzyme
LTDSQKRIHIIGSGGSGKTTLARQLAVIINAPCYELDQIGYENGAKRSLEVRLKDVRQIASQPTWVSEGGFVWWVDDLLQGADVIVWLDLHWTLCYRRIVLRHIRADLARNNAHPGFLRMLRFASGVRPYYLDSVPAIPSAADDDATKNRAAVAQVLSSYSSKMIHCRRSADVAVLLAQMRLSQNTSSQGRQ